MFFDQLFHSIEDAPPGSDILVPDESHMLHVPDTNGSLLADSSQSIQVATSLATALTAQSDHDVIQLLMPNQEVHAHLDLISPTHD